MGYNSPLSYSGLQSGDGKLCIGRSVRGVCVFGNISVCVSVHKPVGVPTELIHILGSSSLLCLPAAAVQH